jgi:hypothetical protein
MLENSVAKEEMQEKTESSERKEGRRNENL